MQSAQPFGQVSTSRHMDTNRGAVEDAFPRPLWGEKQTEAKFVRSRSARKPELWELW